MNGTFDETAINNEAKALHEATLALAKLTGDPEALNRVLRYLNDRFGPKRPPGLTMRNADFNDVETLR